ncbi:MAG: radical SAM protein [Planctomycetes bacterium]|nr:radical SAM protein [Planctomycetota bacterium]
MMNKEYDIILIFPPIREWDRPRNFPTGLGMIAARLRYGGYRVAVIDANGLRLSDEEVLEQIKQHDPKVVGIGGLITTYGWIKRMSGKIRQLKPERPIVLGGSVGTSIVETALRGLDIDAVAVGEADDTVMELMPALLNNGKLDDIAGLAFLRDGEVVQTKERGLIADLDELPYPAWDLFPMRVYLANPIVGVGKDVDIISSRGCPYSCAYCYRIFGKKYRRRSAELVVGEMEALRRNYEVDFISFQDDCFVVDKQRVYDICDLIDHKPSLLSMRWSCTGRATVCDAEMLKRMRASGCVSVSYGIESGSDAILEAMGKRATQEQARQAIENTRAAGLRCPVSFMIGYPGETRETVMETVEFCKKMNIPLSALMFTCPYPGTELYDQVKDSERFKEQYAGEEEFVLKLSDAVDLTVNLTEMSDEELIALRSEALETAGKNYTPPSAVDVEKQERELYGDFLYEKAQEQMQSKAMQAHRRRHGFNEGVGEGAECRANRMPGWVNGQVKPYIIAEAGVNHNGKVETALKLVKAAKEAGADCVKFQAFMAEELVIKETAKADYQKGCGAEGESQYEMLKRMELGVEDFRKIMDYCDELGIDFLVTPFSVGWVMKLEELGVGAFKVGSGNLGVGPLLEAMGETGLPVIVSTGMADIEEVRGTLRRLRGAGCGEIAVLHCVSLYPTPLEKVNLKVIGTLAKEFRRPVGFSDHTVETITGAWAVATGATILEKHLTLNKEMEGPDQKMSLEPKELAEYITQAKLARLAIGSAQKKPISEELKMKETARMSVVARKAIKAGDEFSWDNLTIKRPGTGVPAGNIEAMIG